MEIAYAVEQFNSRFLVVVLCTAKSPPDDEWAPYEGTLRELKARCGGDYTRVRQLVVSDSVLPRRREGAR